MGTLGLRPRSQFIGFVFERLIATTSTTLAPQKRRRRLKEQNECNIKLLFFDAGDLKPQLVERVAKVGLVVLFAILT
jgi:hypothetical protein